MAAQKPAAFQRFVGLVITRPAHSALDTSGDSAFMLTDGNGKAFIKLKAYARIEGHDVLDAGRSSSYGCEAQPTCPNGTRAGLLFERLRKKIP